MLARMFGIFGRSWPRRRGCRYLQTGQDATFVNEETNVILIGSPGSGKTTVGRLLGSLLMRPVVDIDNDWLEPFWKKSVAEKLLEVGDEHFVEEEGKALLNFQSKGHVVSMTGSNPMHAEAMTHVAKSGVVFYLDCADEVILNRLALMKVGRIVGTKSGESLENILQYRKQFYERSYDVRIICEDGESPESIAQKVKRSLDNFQNDPGYISTRSGIKQRKRVSFSHTVLKGLAEDGGLYTRAEPFPTFTRLQLQRLLPLDYRQRAVRVLERLIHPRDLSPQSLCTFTSAAYHPGSFDCADICPVRPLEGNQYILELFHGPTASFKDGALQLMPSFFASALKDVNNNNRRTKYLILVATSGDTGGAVLDGFSRHAGDCGVAVMVLYPSQGISLLQKHQMTTMEGRNIKVIGIDSDFDFCQATVKRIFQDEHFCNQILKDYSFKLSAANSLNWGRLVPQIVYHVSGYLELVKMGVISLGEHIDVCVPTGNFGNILAAYYAKEMGVPLRRLICASNSNNVLTDFIKTGSYDLTSRTLIRTTSPAIDILRSSNLERLLFHLLGNDGETVGKLYADLDRNNLFTVPAEVHDRLQSMFIAGSCSEEECMRTVARIYELTGYLLDPHTAVAKTVADKLCDGECPVLISGTAHFAKFADSVLRCLDHGTATDNLSVSDIIEKSSSLNAEPFMHSGLVGMAKNPVIHQETSPADYESIKNRVLKFMQDVNQN